MCVCFFLWVFFFFGGKNHTILLLPVVLFIVFTKCSQWMVLLHSDDVPYMFQLMVHNWVKERSVTGI